MDMVDVDTLKHVSPTNPHVLKVTRQVFGITNSVSKIQSLEPQVFEVQASKA